MSTGPTRSASPVDGEEAGHREHGADGRARQLRHTRDGNARCGLVARRETPRLNNARTRRRWPVDRDVGGEEPGPVDDHARRRGSGRSRYFPRQPCCRRPRHSASCWEASSHRSHERLRRRRPTCDRRSRSACALVPRPERCTREEQRRRREATNDSSWRGGERHASTSSAFGSSGRVAMDWTRRGTATATDEKEHDQPQANNDPEPRDQPDLLAGTGCRLHRDDLDVRGDRSERWNCLPRLDDVHQFPGSNSGTGCASNSLSVTPNSDSISTRASDVMRMLPAFVTSYSTRT